MTISIRWPCNFLPPYDYASCLLGMNLIRGCQHWSLAVHLVVCTIIIMIPAEYLPDYDLAKQIETEVRHQLRKDAL